MRPWGPLSRAAGANAAPVHAYIGPVLRLLALVFVLTAAASAQVPPAPADTVAADSVRADSVAVQAAAPQTPAQAALGRIRAALAAPGGIALRGPFEPLPPALAGVVWSAPEDPADALDDLLAMRRAGVRAVRTDLIADTLVLRGASLLGLHLYQDLPVQGLPARFLTGQTESAARLLAEALERARPYPAARHFGLARASDTSDPRTRPYFEALTELARERGAPGTRTYYVSRFTRDDRAARTVDLVLLDARDGDPAAAVRQWQRVHDTPVGLAAIGTGVRPGREGGWRTPGSAAAQARTLETAFNDLLALAEPPAVTFVYRWRDASEDALARDQRAEVTGTRFGLLDENDEARPAFEVAEGFWTGRQRVFAYDAGRPAGQDRQGSPLLLMGWGLALGLGLFYAAAPRLSGMAPRYFGRRDLYRDAVQRGYDLSMLQTAGLALGLSLAVGIVVTAALRALGRTDTLVAATAAWTPEAQLQVTDLIGRPLVLVLLLSVSYAVWLLLNVIWLKLMAGRRRLRPAQALSLVVWCRWAWLPLMVVALVLGGLDARLATLLAPAILGVGLLVEIVAGYRMMSDLQAVTNAPPARAVLIGFGLPFLVVVGGLAVLALVSRDEAGFLWHLATRG